MEQQPMERQIVCLGIPRFEVALARLADPTLRTRPVAVATIHATRAIIREVSREAEDAGVVPGLPAERARQRCPSLQLVPPHPSRVARAHHALLPSITRIAPVWESSKPGHFFLDLTGTTRLFGTAGETTMRLERELAHRLGLQSVAGVGTNKLIAQMASCVVTPPQLCEVRAGSEQDFLRPLPVSTLPGLRNPQGTALQTTLAELNLQTIADLAALELDDLETVFGRWGQRLYHWARGIDSSPVSPSGTSSSLACSHLFEPDAIDQAQLLGGLSILIDTLCRDLRRQQHVGNRLTLILCYSDQQTVSRSCSLATPTHWEVEMFPSIRSLFRRCFQRRIRVRSLTIRSNRFRPPPEQLPLFPTEQEYGQQGQPPRPHRLALALDRLHTRFGMKVIQWGRSHMASH
jgi:DNA polymerase IV